MSGIIQQYIDDFLAKKDAEQKERPAISASNIGKCPRCLMLGYFKKEPIPWTAQQLRVFEAGRQFEKFAMACIPKEKIVAEQLWVEYRGFTGTLDLIIENMQKNLLMDLKSVHSKKFNYLDKEGIDKGYIYQLTFYWLALKDNKKLANIAGLAYIEKECILTKEMWFNPEEYTDMVNKRIDGLQSAISKNHIPAEKTEPDWECFSVRKLKKKPIDTKLWCRYIEHCPAMLRAYHNTCAEIGIAPDYRLKKQENLLS